MRRLWSLLGIALAITIACWSSLASAEAPKLSEERVVLRTLAGDMVLVLYPEVAPRTVEQILKLVRGGVYDTTAFVRVEPGFVAQLSAANDRTIPVNDQQKALIHRIPGEFTSVKHVRGVLSMAREDGDPDSNETSFSILLGPAPHLDGKYTVFGRLEAGEAVLEEMVKVPRDDQRRPLVRLEVIRAEVLSASALAATTIAPAKPFVVPPELMRGTESVAPGTGKTASTVPTTEVACGIGLICVIGLVSFLLQGKVASTVHSSLNMTMVLVGAFLIVVVLVPLGHRSPWVAAALFFGLVGLFKLLGRFESPAQR